MLQSDIANRFRTLGPMTPVLHVSPVDAASSAHDAAHLGVQTSASQTGGLNSIASHFPALGDASYIAETPEQQCSRHAHNLDREQHSAIVNALDSKLGDTIAAHCNQIDGGLDLVQLYESEVHPVKLCALLAKQQLDKAYATDAVAYTLSADVIENIQNRIKMPFTVDCSALGYDVPAACDKHLPTLKEVLQTDLSGQVCYIHAHTASLPAILSHYMTCKKHAPEKTVAVFVVTEHGLNKLQSKLQNLQHVQTLKKGQQVVIKHWHNAPPR